MTAMPRVWIRLPDGEISPCDDPIDFAAWYGTSQADCMIEKTAVPYGPNLRDAVVVTTSFTCFEHLSPQGDVLLYETRLQLRHDGHDREAVCRRYKTEDGARSGHAEVVDAVARNAVRGVAIEKMPLQDIAVPDKAPLPANQTCLVRCGTGIAVNAYDMEVLCECTLRPSR